MDAFIGTILPWPVPYAPAGWALCNGQVLNINQNQALFSLIGNLYGGNAGQQTFALPNLQGRTIIGAGTYIEGGTQTFTYPFTQPGGSRIKTLTVANLPPHAHMAGNLKVNCDSSQLRVSSAFQGNNLTASTTYGVPATTDNTAANASKVPGPDYVLGPAKGIPSPEVNTYFKPSADPAKNVTLKTSEISVSGSVTGTVTSTISGTINATTDASAITGVTGSGSPIDGIPPYIALYYIISLTGIYPTRD